MERDPSRPQHIAPVGEHTHVEYLIRITTADGRASDHGPYVAESAEEVRRIVFRCAPGSTRSALRRTVTTSATPWEPVPNPAEGGAP